MNPESRYETQRIDHLGIVAGIRKEIGLIKEINRQVEPREQKVSVGQGTQAKVLNALGFSSRALYAKGVTEVFAQVAAGTLRVYGIEHRFVHVDSSSFHLLGQYEIEEPDKEAITVTEGYSLDHRPDLKQVVVQLITSQKLALPVWLEVLSGNSCDKETFPLSVEAYNKQLGESQAPWYVMDSAGYAAENLKTLKDLR